MTMVWDSAAQTFPVFITPDGPDRAPDFIQRRTLRAVLNRAIGSGAANNEAHVPIYFPERSILSRRRQLKFARVRRFAISISMPARFRFITSADGSQGFHHN